MIFKSYHNETIFKQNDFYSSFLISNQIICVITAVFITRIKHICLKLGMSIHADVWSHPGQYPVHPLTPSWSHKGHAHSHEWSTHIPFILCQYAFPLLKWGYFTLWPWIFKVMGVAKGQGHMWSAQNLTRTTRMPAFWSYPPPLHDYPYYWFISDPKSKQDKVKVTNLKNLPKIQMLNFAKKLDKRHTFLSCLIRYVWLWNGSR